jgi:hypothetical protein
MEQYTQPHGEVEGKSDQPHSPEPWYVLGDGRAIGTKLADPLLDRVGTAAVAMCIRYRRMPAQANARRIVAAINAVKGIPTEQLEHVASQSGDAMREAWLVKAAFSIDTNKEAR